MTSLKFVNAYPNDFYLNKNIALNQMVRRKTKPDKCIPAEPLFTEEETATINNLVTLGRTPTEWKKATKLV